MLAPRVVSGKAPSWRFLDGVVFYAYQYCSLKINKDAYKIHYILLRIFPLYAIHYFQNFHLYNYRVQFFLFFSLFLHNLNEITKITINFIATWHALHVRYL